MRGRNETTADFRLNHHRTAVAAFSPQLLPQASHAMRLTELSVSLSVQDTVTKASLPLIAEKAFTFYSLCTSLEKKKKIVCISSTDEISKSTKK